MSAIAVARPTIPPPMIAMFRRLGQGAENTMLTAPFAAGVLGRRAMDLEYLMVPAAPPPPPTAPYSHAVRAGDFLFVTGQMPSDPRTGDRLVPGGIVEQTHQVMKNLQTVLAGAGTSLDR